MGWYLQPPLPYPPRPAAPPLPVLELEAQGVLDNTYIIYMSDNGWVY
jgi:hypothetical protein